LFGFAGCLLVFAALEAWRPQKARTMPRTARWLTNGLLTVLNTAALRLAVPLLAVGTAIWATDAGLGLFNVWDAPLWLTVPATVILLDLAIYAQHVALHKVPFLWRFHKVHHVDTEIDVTTGLRFHPLEIVASMAYKMGCVAVLGAPVEAVIMFEIVLNASTLFNHSNLRLSGRMDRLLRAVIVTPDMHRVHHSTFERETNSNYGFFLSIWDRLFRTHRRAPAEPLATMAIGLAEHQDARPSSLLWSLVLPFRR
jgi:sterol desaturase/sphingolipid hydroxylase (fatty acid hydroxylase superfamily)